MRGIVANERVIAGRSDEALKPYEQAAASLETLMGQDRANADWQAELSSVKLRWAQALRVRDPERARALYQEGLALATELVEKDRTNVVWSLMLVDALSTPIGIDEADQDRQRRRALAIVTDLQSRNALPRTWRDGSSGLAQSLAGPGAGR